LNKLDAAYIALHNVATHKFDYEEALEDPMLLRVLIQVGSQACR
jgi:hypothetical protein